MPVIICPSGLPACRLAGPRATHSSISQVYTSVMASFIIDGEEALDREVKPFGNSAHVTVPKRWLGSEVKVVRVSEPDK